MLHYLSLLCVLLIISHCLMQHYLTTPSYTKSNYHTVILHCTTLHFLKLSQFSNYLVLSITPSRTMSYYLALIHTLLQKCSVTQAQNWIFITSWKVENQNQSKRWAYCNISLNYVWIFNGLRDEIKCHVMYFLLSKL